MYGTINSISKRTNIYIMAKSMRSAVKKRFRSIKRDARISVEDERLARLAARLRERQQLQSTTAEKQKSTMQIPDEMEVDEKAKHVPASAKPGDRGRKHAQRQRARSKVGERVKAKGSW